MKTRPILITITALALLLAAGLLLPQTRGRLGGWLSTPETADAQDPAGESGNRTPNGDDTGSAPRVAPLPVQGVVVDLSPFELTLRASGRAEAVRRVELAPRVGERVNAVHVEPGDAVRTGQTLIELDRRPFEIARAEAQAALTTAEIDARVQLMSDENPTEEKRALVDDRSGVTAARQQLARADLDLEGTRLTAPFAGSVVSVDTDLGARVRPDDPVVTLVDLSTIRVAAEVLEASFGRVQVGSPARLKFAALPDRVFEGTVTRISPELDPQRGTGVAYIELDNRDGLVKPGMFAEVEIVASVHTDRLSVPRVALLERDRKLLVFRATGGRAEWQYVDTGLETESRVEITDGLAPGDTVLVGGHLTLAHAAPVRVTVENPR